MSKKNRRRGRDAADQTRHPHANGRRKLLKSALLGGGAAVAMYSAPERWTRPVIESVSLPAHAQTSLELGEGPWAGGSPLDGVMNTPVRGRTLAGRVADILVPSAHALVQEPPLCSAMFNICISGTGTGNEIAVRSGFMGSMADDRTVPLDSNLKFAFNFGDYNVTGKYNPATDRWNGHVSGPCPELTTSSSTGSSVFTGEHIQVASAAENLQLAGFDPSSGLDADWQASPGEICVFDDF